MPIPLIPCPYQRLSHRSNHFTSHYTISTRTIFVGSEWTLSSINSRQWDVSRPYLLFVCIPLNWKLQLFQDNFYWSTFPFRRNSLIENHTINMTISSNKLRSSFFFLRSCFLFCLYNPFLYIVDKFIVMSIDLFLSKKRKIKKNFYHYHGEEYIFFIRKVYVVKVSIHVYIGERTFSIYSRHV